MASLVLTTVLGAVLVVGVLVGLSRAEEHLADAATAGRLETLRADTESTWLDWVTGSWVLLSLGATTFSLLRGEAIGVAWLAAAALLGTGLVLLRRRRARVLRLLGDRGRVARTDRYRRRRRLSLVLLAVALGGFVVERFLAQAFQEPRPDAAVAVVLGAVLAQVVGLLGALAVRVRMWTAGDDLDRPSRDDRTTGS